MEQEGDLIYNYNFNNLTTKYYSMQEQDGELVSMPLICEEQDRIAAVVMKKLNPESTFLGDYVNAFGFPSLREAEQYADNMLYKKMKKGMIDVGVAFYHLHPIRHQYSKTKKDDLINAHVPKVYKK